MLLGSAAAPKPARSIAAAPSNWSVEGGEEAQDRVAEAVVHGRVEAVAAQLAQQGGVLLPLLGHGQRFRILVLDHLAESGHQSVGKVGSPDTSSRQPDAPSPSHRLAMLSSARTK